MSASVMMLFTRTAGAGQVAAGYGPESGASMVRQLDERLDHLRNPEDAQAAILVFLDFAAASSPEWRAEAAAELVGLLIADFDAEAM